MIGLAEVRAAAGRIAGRVLRTPALRSDAISRATGADVTLKLENLQAIGSFKERGAANKLALLSEAERARGVIAMSAGNHAQAVARHASLAGIAAVIVMPQRRRSRRFRAPRAGGRRWCCMARRWPRRRPTPRRWPPSAVWSTSIPMTIRR